MDVLSGLLLINNIDPYVVYGVFLAEKDKNSMKNYEELLKPPALKSHLKVDYREENGVRLPATLKQRWKERRVSLTFAIVASNVVEYERRYHDFINFLKTGDDGWLTIKVTELSRSWRMYMVEFSEYEQLSNLNGEVVSRFTVTFEEPQPNF